MEEKDSYYPGSPHPEIRLLKAEEIETRVGICKTNGCTLLLYKDARCDMRILDETFGPMNWKRDHQLIGASLYCTVSIFDPVKSEWIGKQDVGTENFMEKEKSTASDAFKRACFNVGIGRELYTSPFMWIPLHPEEVVKSNNKFQLSPKVKFTVAQIEYTDRKITAITIVDQDGLIRYIYPKSQLGNPPVNPSTSGESTNEDLVKEALQDIATCQTRSQLVTVYNKYKGSLKDSTDFIDAVKARQDFIKNTPQE